MAVAAPAPGQGFPPPSTARAKGIGKTTKGEREERGCSMRLRLRQLPSAMERAVTGTRKQRARCVQRTAQRTVQRTGLLWSQSVASRGFSPSLGRTAAHEAGLRLLGVVVVPFEGIAQDLKGLVDGHKALGGLLLRCLAVLCVRVWVASFRKQQVGLVGVGGGHGGGRR